MRWFESMGVQVKWESTGKLFPVSNKARTVLEALLHRCNELGVTLMTQQRVKSVEPTPTGFQIVHERGLSNAQCVILATGGQSVPKSGSDGHGWVMVRQLGHTVAPTNPALVPFIFHDSFFHRLLSGISHDATLTTRVNGKIVDRRTGNLLWTHFGVSGPVVLDASRFWTIAHGQGHEVKVFLSFFPDNTLEGVDRWLSDAARQPGNKRVMPLLANYLPNRVAKAICSYVEELPPLPSSETRSKPTSSAIGTLPLESVTSSTTPGLGADPYRSPFAGGGDARMELRRSHGWRCASIRDRPWVNDVTKNPRVISYWRNAGL